MSALAYYKREKLVSLDPLASPFATELPSEFAGGDFSAAISHQIRSMLQGARAHPDLEPKNDQTPSQAISERLFKARAEAKVLTSSYAMHLRDEWRVELFAKLDALLDADDWHDDNVVLHLDSYRTYLRFTLHVRPTCDPFFGLSDEGHLLGAWIVGKNRLTMEFLPGDEIRWVLVRYIEEERETAAAQIPLVRLQEVLQPFDPDLWWMS